MYVYIFITHSGFIYTVLSIYQSIYLSGGVITSNNF